MTHPLYKPRLHLAPYPIPTSQLAKGSDENWCQKLYSGHSKHAHFDKPRLSRESFVVVHFADSVCYSIAGFVEKNRDRVHQQHINILKASQVVFAIIVIVDWKLYLKHIMYIVLFISSTLTNIYIFRYYYCVQCSVSGNI